MAASSAIAKQWNFGTPINALAMNRRGTRLAVALGDGSLRLIAANEDADRPKEMELHRGISLSLMQDADDHAFLSGGDDGKIFIIDPELETPTLLAEQKNKWIDHVAASSEGEYRAYSAGKNVYLLDADGNEAGAPRELPSSAGGLAFSPNGKRLAASHYNGISLFWTNAKDSAATKLAWKGSHLGLAWHPDNKTIMSAMQESSLHGWRLSDNKEMQMQGYVGKIHDMDFTVKARYLATGGAEQVICWPFFGGGPWGKTPLMLGGSDGRLVSRVAPHPKDEMLAAGYEDGMIIMAPLDGRMEMMVQPPSGSNVVGLAWNTEGDCLFAALENGQLFLFTIESVKKMVHV